MIAGDSRQSLRRRRDEGIFCLGGAKMAFRKLNLMISSRCDVEFPFDADDAVPLTKLRKQLKREIEAEKYLGNPLINNVWINEEESGSGSETSWDECMKQAANCDLFLSIIDGQAGWQKGHPENPSGIGICHAEFETAYSSSPGKVRVMSLLTRDREENIRPGPDRDFLDAISAADLLESRRVTTKDDFINRAKSIVREMVLEAANEGAKVLSSSGANTGLALDWSRMNFQNRQKAISDTIHHALFRRARAKEVGDYISVPISGQPILFVPSAIPAAFSVSAAREMVGQPFLNDHELADILPRKGGGPVHVIGCHKGVTEKQAMSILGFPDATIIAGNFGVYVADNIQKIQICLIANCTDPNSTKHGLQRLFDWLERTGEAEYLSKRSSSRARILRAIAKEAITEET